jgi:hypothetical protein
LPYTLKLFDIEQTLTLEESPAPKLNVKLSGPLRQMVKGATERFWIFRTLYFIRDEFSHPKDHPRFEKYPYP